MNCGASFGLFSFSLKPIAYVHRERGVRVTTDCVIKKLSDNQQEYNDVHGFYCAGVEHLFARLWHWKIVRNVWMGSARDLHQHVRVLLHLTQFCIRRQTRYQPYVCVGSTRCSRR